MENWKYTGFDRFPEGYGNIEKILPSILDKNEPINICTAPCANGLDALTILFHLLNNMDFSELRRRVKVDGFDCAEESIEIAKKGKYQGTLYEGERLYVEEDGTDYHVESDTPHSIDDMLKLFKIDFEGGNVKFQVKEDIMKLLHYENKKVEEIDTKGKYDMLFSIWLFQYYFGNDKLPLIKPIVSSIKEGGYLITNYKCVGYPNIDEDLIESNGMTFESHIKDKDGGFLFYRK